MKRRAERTYFNTEYMPELYEDAIESNDPLEVERLCRGTVDDVVKSDKERFSKLCRKHGFNFTKLNKEYERKKKAADELRRQLPDLQRELNQAVRRGYNRKAETLRRQIDEINGNIKSVMEE